MKPHKLSSRHIHLDFHTGTDVPNVGCEFNPQQFADTLKKAHVTSINLFARCHHGYLYYDSKAFPERIHPNLTNKNMLNEMVDACHEKNINAPIYLTVQWDKFTAEEHPQWLVIDENGRHIGQKVYEAGFYESLCVNTKYRDMLKLMIKDVFDCIKKVDGFWFDIVYPTDCSCSVCRKKMLELNINAYDKKQRMKYAISMIDDFKRDISSYVANIDDTVSVFYNTSHVGVLQKDVLDAYSHIELESLPSGDWGYMHFPITMRYARTLGLDCLAHTGKFHIEWGDLHSFKNEKALEYECFRMIAMGAKCLIGDQLDPSGKLNKHVYNMIGNVYKVVERLEAWCDDVKPRNDLAVMTAEEFVGGLSLIHI